jgi:uncharacterized protein
MDHYPISKSINRGNCSMFTFVLQNGSMQDYINTLAARAQSRMKDFRELAARCRRLKNSRLDQTFHDLHHEAFSRINCLECANCCRGLGPRLVKTDIERVSSFLKMKSNAFIETYLHLDEDHDYVFKSMPCPFLLDDNHCMVYDVRPRACREYPHTDQKNIKSILSVCLKNTQTCPAVFRIFEQLPGHLSRK